MAAAVPEADLRDGVLFPRIADLRSVTTRVAEAVIAEAVRSGLADPVPDPAAAVAAAMWEPRYGPIEPA